MSQEHHHANNEHAEHDKAELEQARAEQLESLQHKAEASPDDSAERARVARETIHKPEHHPEPTDQAETAPAEPVHRPLPHLDYKLNYTETMASVQRKLTPVSRTFSKVIHVPAIEKASEALESTVARPSLTAGATWTALIMGSLFYFTARHFGYILSGSEITLSFLVGAIIGLALESAWRAAFRRR
jgi:hypothetical protein